MDRHGVDQSELAQRLGHKPHWASQFLGGSRGVPIATAEAIAGIFGVETWELFVPPSGGEASSTAASTAPAIRQYERRGIQIEPGVPDAFTRVPMLGGRIAAGEPLLLEGTPDTYLAFRAEFARRFTAPVLMRVGRKEESMLPEIHPDDVIAMDQAEERRLKVQPDRMYVLNLDGGGTIKHVEIMDSHIVITAKNPDRARYPTRIERVPDDQSVLDIVRGEVVWIGRYMGSGRSKR